MNTTTKEKRNPGSLEDLKEMFEAGLHCGHRTFRWNPKMSKFIFSKQNGIHVFDLSITAKKLEEALAFLKKTASEGKTILFVGTKVQSQDFAERAAKECDMHFITKKWFAGFLTNFKTFRLRIDRLKELEEQFESGEIERFKKKEISRFSKEKSKLEAGLGGVKSLQALPDAVFVLDASRDKTTIAESVKKKIPVVAITDTNADPSLIDFPIPANDDSVSSIKFIVDRVIKAVKEGRNRKK